MASDNWPAFVGTGQSLLIGGSHTLIADFKLVDPSCGTVLTHYPDLKAGADAVPTG